jgi:hypothetical protein
MFQFICTFIVLLVIVSIVWPDPRIKQRDVDRRHTETLAVIAVAARHSAAPAAPIAPTSGPAYRAHVIALGRIRDRENGQPRHPLLDSPPKSVAGRQT